MNLNTPESFRELTRALPGYLDMQLQRICVGGGEEKQTFSESREIEENNNIMLPINQAGGVHF